jgi:hypothetical protein
MAEKSRMDQANRQQKPGLVWRNRKKISQIIKDYFCLPFFLLIILWVLQTCVEKAKTNITASIQAEIKSFVLTIQLLVHHGFL